MLLCTEAELVDDGFFVGETGGSQEGDGDTPRFSRGFVAAGLVEGINGGEAGVACEVCLQDFAAPDRAVWPVARAVEGDAEDGFVIVVFGEAGEDVGVVVLDGKQRDVERVS